MNYCRLAHIRSDAANLKDAEVFTVYDDKSGKWGFAMRINGVFTVTKLMDQHCDEDGVRNAKKQILFCKHYGWSYTGQKAFNLDVDEVEPEFCCLYCRAITFDTTDPCVCRGKTRMDFAKKTPGGIILPF